MSAKIGKHPREAEGEKTRQEILRVGLDLFAKQGYSDTTITQIAAAANTYRSSVDWHFGGKEGLLLAVVEFYLEQRLVRDIEALWQAFSSQNPAASPRQTMDSFMLSLGRMLERDLPVLVALFTLTFEQINKNPPLAEKIRNFWSSLINTSAEVIRKGQERGLFRSGLDPVWTAKSLVALCQGLFMQWYMEPEKLSTQEALSHITSAISRLLFEEKAGSAPTGP